MNVLTRVQQVRLAVKNVGRMREIATTMGQFGFNTLLDRIGLGRFASSKNLSVSVDTPLPIRLRLLCEKLGPTFIKLGQVLSSRPDLIPAEILEELVHLQDDVEPVSILEIQPVIERSLGRKLNECFASFDTEPMATASIAQVHAARSLEGDDVVVKVIKPNVHKLITQDLEILEMIANLIETYIPEVKVFRPRAIVTEFKRSLLAETDFEREFFNIKNYRENFADSDFLYIPKPYADLSTKEVLTMERIRGIKLSNLAEIRAMGTDTREVLARGMDAFYKSIMIDGLFHSDPHGGNIFVLPDGRMALVDFGSVGYLSDSSKRAVVSMFLALLAQDYEWLVQEYVQLSPASQGTRTSRTMDALSEEIYNLFSPYHGRPLRSIPSGKLLMDASSLALKHQVVLPADLVMVFKSIMTLEGLAREMDPDFDLVSAGAGYAKNVLKTLYKPEYLLKEIAFTGRDTLNFVRHFPRQAAEITRQIECGDLKLNIDFNNAKVLADAQVKGFSILGQSVVAAAVLIVAANVSSDIALPHWALISMWTIAIVFTTWTGWRSFRAK
ncbi:hypothetical protein GW916_09435 [bacterium]|nr:hypothetical protein [bacterium]